MKKLTCFLISLLILVVTSYAQKATGSYRMTNSSKELVVSYFNDHSIKKSSGHLEVTNNSDNKISKAHVLVQVLITWSEDVPGIDPFTGDPLSIERKFDKILVLCDDDIFDIPPHKTIIIDKTARGIVKGGPEKYNDPKKKNKKYNYSVEVTNVSFIPLGYN